MPGSRETRGPKDPQAEELGRRISTRRRELGFSRRDLVAGSGLSYPYVSQLETGYRLPSHKSLARLAHALQLDPAKLSSAIAYDEMAMSELPPSPQAAPPRAVVSSPVRADSMRMANPDYAGRSKPPRTPKVRVSGVVDQIVGLAATLPVDRRLEALHRAQRQVMDQIVAEEVEGARD